MSSTRYNDNDAVDDGIGGISSNENENCDNKNWFEKEAL